MNDEYQPRYEKHQQFGKKQELIALMKERHSNRRFDKRPISEEHLNDLLESVKHCPSSCDRHGVRIKIITERNDKDLLDGLLVGGTGWVYRTPMIFLLMADPIAYKADNGRELGYNAYVDAGVMLQQLSLMATSLGLHCAIINPNIRDENVEFFYQRFTPKEWAKNPPVPGYAYKAQYCGAFCFGYPHQEPIQKERNLIDKMDIK